MTIPKSSHNELLVIKALLMALMWWIHKCQIFSSIASHFAINPSIALQNKISGSSYPTDWTVKIMCSFFLKSSTLSAHFSSLIICRNFSRWSSFPLADVTFASSSPFLFCSSIKMRPHGQNYLRKHCYLSSLSPLSFRHLDTIMEGLVTKNFWLSVVHISGFLEICTQDRQRWEKLLHVDRNYNLCLKRRRRTEWWHRSQRNCWLKIPGDSS